jgi:hypothetical protein
VRYERHLYKKSKDISVTATYHTNYSINEPQIKRFKNAEIQEVINNLNSKKSSGYNRITGQILKALLIIGMKYLTQLFSSVLQKG